MKTPKRPARGISLIEALVALAVMAFGLLGVVGMQATLRGSSDISRQRAEAVRIAQLALEDWRGFASLTADAGAVDYTDIVDGTATVAGLNTTYLRAATVRPVAAAASEPKVKTVTMSVGWSDRSGQPASVTLVSSIAGIAPALAGALALPADRAAGQRPLGRRAWIPLSAVDQGNGTSSFTPPGAATGISWVFNDTTGIITSICTAPLACLPVDQLLLSGYVRFATGSAVTAVTPELPIPTGLPPSIGVKVVLTAPAQPDVRCYTEAFSDYTAYYCAVPTVSVTRIWSGQSVIDMPAALPSTDPVTNGLRVCRYTPQATHTPAAGNAAHPLVYSNVSAALSNQNFLMVDLAYACPADGPSTLSNTTTFAHQPSS